MYLSLAYSRYAQRVLAAKPALLTVLERAVEMPWSVEAITARAEELCQTLGLTKGLRQLRSEVLLSLMERDLRNQASLFEVTEVMTRFAEISVQKALAWHTAQLSKRYGTPIGMHSKQLQELLVVGMGKLGGRELNVSSDIDLIYLYEEEGETVGDEHVISISNHEFFDRLARQLTQALSDVNEDGFVFRIDLRLRPNGSEGFLACSLAMLEEYFKTRGRDWERYAWIKGRLLPVCSSVERCQPLLQTIVHRFVYRRYVDFGVMAALRNLYAKMRMTYSIQGSRFSPSMSERNGHYGLDIKRASGGIRDIEFIAQTFQLIHAGQSYGLRQQATLVVLEQLAERALMSAEHVALLRQSYIFLRNLEHRLQYLDDMQTHALPHVLDDQKRLAVAMGEVDYEALLAHVLETCKHVQQRFEAIFPDKIDAPKSDQPSLWDIAVLPVVDPTVMESNAVDVKVSVQPSHDPHALLPLLLTAQASNYYCLLTRVNKQRFDRLIRSTLDYVLYTEWGKQQADVMTIVARALSLFEVLSRYEAYLALLNEYPQALMRVIQLLATSGWAANYLTQHPQLLDEVLQDARPQPADYWRKFAADLRAYLQAVAGQSEVQMDILRHAQQAQTFRILLRDSQGQLSVEQVADHLSALADILLQLALDTIWAQLERPHCHVPHFAIIAYGRLGGKELGYASDLDLVFLYDDDHEDAQNTYTNLARKLVTWLTSHTGVGVLYDVDLRLRPNGEAGLMVTDLEEFRRYQMREGDNSAWVWEHQALVRARFCAGDSVLGAAFEAIRAQVLTQRRQPKNLQREILAMRERMLKAHVHSYHTFDIKYSRGGMVDIEFIVQYLVLLHSIDYPQLLANLGNIALLPMAAKAGLIDLHLAEQVAQLYRNWRALQHRKRLDGINPVRIALSEVAPEHSAVIALWNSLFDPLLRPHT